MVKKRDHYLTFSWATLEQDEDTGKMSVDDSFSYSGWCGVFLNSKARSISSGYSDKSGGVARVYHYLITADPGITVPAGARVTIEGKEFEVIAVSPLQKHTELWV